MTLEPEHPYTRRLLLAAPLPHPIAQEQRRAERLRLRVLQEEQDLQAGLV